MHVCKRCYYNLFCFEFDTQDFITIGILSSIIIFFLTTGTKLKDQNSEEEKAKLTDNILKLVKPMVLKICCWHSCLVFCWFNEEWGSCYEMSYLLLRNSSGVHAAWMNVSSFHCCHEQYVRKIPVEFFCSFLFVCKLVGIDCNLFKYMFLYSSPQLHNAISVCHLHSICHNF